MDNSTFLYDTLLQEFGKRTIENINIPLSISSNLNPKFVMREYQKQAFRRFLCYYENSFDQKTQPIHLLYNMATGSGKTFVMAGLILYLYEQWHRNFLFFVNSNNIITKTKANFIESNSSKYLFDNTISINGQRITIKEVRNFTNHTSQDIQIKFTTIQWLHSDLNNPKENGLSYEDFADKKVVILSDEAHHINATTKKWKLNKGEQDEKQSWEKTVMKILNSHRDNILLEFTATIDVSDPDIKAKYLNKIIYKYDLKEFRDDGYSKEVDIFKSDIDTDYRILQAIILSQYRLKIAEKYLIYCKPVILFKAQKTIKESEENMNNVINLIKQLTPSTIQTVREQSSHETLKSAFNFFDEQDISDENLIAELQHDFAPEHCISANDSDDLVWVKLNTLEDKTNNIRAVFAVAKLNEWWDVLNLFDIVRLYDSRDGDWKKDGSYKAGKGTISEAQLIGRWARYFPFITSEALGDDRFTRKFDRTNHELKVLETLYYHTSFDSKYITEIKQALQEIGMIDIEEKTKFTLELKEEFMSGEFYQQWVIYTNKRKLKWWVWVDSLVKAWIDIQRFDYRLNSNLTDTESVFDNDTKKSAIKLWNEIKSFMINKINLSIVRKALWKNKFYTFNNLTQYLWELQNMDEFISNDTYLWNIIIDYIWTQQAIEHITNQQYLNSVSRVLTQLESQIKNQIIHYEGTKEFKPQSVKTLFKPQQEIMLNPSSQDIIFDKEWFVYKHIKWSTEEGKFVNLFNKKITQLQKKYEDIYLMRSERTFAIYSFDKGERFEPDFVLFMRAKNNPQPLTYQIFIEPKWDHLLLLDSRKQEFLWQIDTQAQILDLNFGNYKLIWLPFYNHTLEQEFEQAMDEKLSTS